MRDISAARRVGRDSLPRPELVPPVRIVHLGLGAFHRSHQAWYTAHATDADCWGIAAYTGRRPDAADVLSDQGCVYTLVQRGPAEDRFELVGSVVKAVPGDEVGDFIETVASAEVAVLTLTITEAGYRLDAQGALDLDDPEIRSDISKLRRQVGRCRIASEGAPRTALGRILLGLNERRLRDRPAIAIVPCDNLPANGSLVASALAVFAAQVSDELASWLPGGVSYVSTSVDRITPRLEPGDKELVAMATGWSDEAPVIAEPFTDWVLSGDFPSGRPQWESAGARFVDDVTPWETRKLWLLNGAHSLLASTGRLRGHATVAQAFADAMCRASVEQLWDEAARHLPGVEILDYRRALADRFGNPRIVHRLAQIADGASTKLRLRVVPVALLERSAGRPAAGCATAIAAWALFDGLDAEAALRDLSPELADDRMFANLVRTTLTTLAAE